MRVHGPSPSETSSASLSQSSSRQDRYRGFLCSLRAIEFRQPGHSNISDPESPERANHQFYSDSRSEGGGGGATPRSIKNLLKLLARRLPRGGSGVARKFINLFLRTAAFG